jgi:serine protease Do
MNPTEDPRTSLDDEPADIVIVEIPPPPPISWKTVLLASAISLLAGTLLTLGVLDALGIFERLDDVESFVETSRNTPPVELPASERDVVSQAAARAIPSIVTIQQFDPNVGPTGSGSGVVFRSDGYILTNDHVVRGAVELRVVFSDGLTYPAELVGTDPLTDVAMLRVDVDGLTAIQIGDLSTATIGDLAIAVGNPLGLDGGPSVTAGVISAFDRTLNANGLRADAEPLYGLLQTDAPITRGSSGGALVNRNGELIGITTAIGVSDVGAEGLGFAVPVTLLEGVAADLIANGGVPHAYLGIEGQSAYVVRDDGSQTPLGAQIRRLLEDSAIGLAGAEEGDVIVALDGETVNSFILLVARLREYRAGDTVTVTLNRDGSDVDIDLVLDRHPNSWGSADDRPKHL